MRVGSRLACQSTLCLVEVRRIADWPAFGPGAAQLRGDGYLMVFAELVGNRQATAEIHRVRRQVRKVHTCQVGSNGVAYQNGSAAFVFRA